MKYYDNPTYAKWCEMVYGKDLKQVGMVTENELELFFSEVNANRVDSVLDLGCGAGYIASAISERLNANVTGIDIDDEAIAHAKKEFENNKALNFQIMDFNELSFAESSFDLITSFDTLYFTFSIEKLRLLLDKCMTLLKPGGKLAVFWTNLPQMYPMDIPEAGFTQVGIWGKDNSLEYKSFELTTEHRKFWSKALEALLSLEAEFNAIENEIYEPHVKEYTYVSQLCEEEKVFRWFYVFAKQ